MTRSPKGNRLGRRRSSSRRTRPSSFRSAGVGVVGAAGTLVLEREPSDGHSRSSTRSPRRSSPAGFHHIAEEMAVVEYRASYSPIIREMLDFNCGLFTADGRMIANSEQIPAQLGLMQFALESSLRSGAMTLPKATHSSPTTRIWAVPTRPTFRCSLPCSAAADHRLGRVDRPPHRHRRPVPRHRERAVHRALPGGPDLPRREARRGGHARAGALRAGRRQRARPGIDPGRPAMPNSPPAARHARVEELCRAHGTDIGSGDAFTAREHRPRAEAAFRADRPAAVRPRGSWTTAGSRARSRCASTPRPGRGRHACGRSLGLQRTGRLGMNVPISTRTPRPSSLCGRSSARGAPERRA